MIELSDRLSTIESRIGKKDIKFARKSFIDYQRHLEKIRNYYRLDDLKEAESKLLSIYHDMFFTNERIGLDSRGQVVKKGDVTLSDYFVNVTLNEISKNPSLLWTRYDKLNQQERAGLLRQPRKTIYTYSANLDENVSTVLDDVIHTILANAKISEYDYIKGLTAAQRLEFQKVFDYCTKQFRTDGRKEIHEAYVSRIVKMAKLLDETGELERNAEIYNKRMESVGLRDLEVEYIKKKKGNKPQLTATRDLTDKRVVDGLNFESLAMYAAFLSNRVNKIFRDQSLAAFIKDQIQERRLSDVSDDEIKALLVKYRYILDLQRDTYAQKTAELVANLNRGERSASANCMYDLEFDITEMQTDREQYKKFFDERLDAFENNFDEDAFPIVADSSYFEGMLNHKDFAIKALVANLAKGSNTFVNWGYIPEEHDGRNSIERGSRMILIAADHSGYNQPVRFHISRKELMEIVEGVTGKKEIPVYQGEQDWTIDPDASYTSTQLVLPITKFARTALRNYVEGTHEDNVTYPYMEHVAWMNGLKSRPARFKDEVIDLETGNMTERVKSLED